MRLERKQKKRLLRCIARNMPPYRYSNYGIAYCPCLWMKVFIDFFRELPAGNTDPRWDTVLHKLKGLRMINTLLGKREYWLRGKGGGPQAANVQ